MEEEPDRLAKLAENARLLRDALDKVSGVTVRSKEVTPVVHLELTTPLASSDAEAALLARIAALCVEQGVAIAASKFAIKNSGPLRPSLTLNASTMLNKGEITKIAAVLTSALRAFKVV
jgi:7-keto-8-aminopelargonate synthetase-like enzyme